MEVKLNFTIEEMESFLIDLGYQISSKEMDFSEREYHNNFHDFKESVKTLSRDGVEIPYDFSPLRTSNLADQQVIEIFTKELRKRVLKFLSSERYVTN